MPLPLPNAAERFSQLAVIFPANGEKQSAIDTPTDTAVITDAIALTSRNWVDEAITVEEIFDCMGEDPADEEITRILYRLPISGNFYASLVARLAAYGYGIAGAPSGAPANTVQTITITGAPTGGNFQLALTHLGGTETTLGLTVVAGVLPTASRVRAALESLANIGFGNVDVTLAGNAYTVTFKGKRAGYPIPALIPTNNLTGGVAPAVAVNVTTPGSNRTANIARNSGYQNPYFSFIVGFRDDAASFMLCYNAIANNLRIVAPANRGIVTFEAELIFSGKMPMGDFDAPACYTPPTVRTSDCSLIYDGGDVTPSLVSMEAVLIDNGTLTGDFAYTGRRITPTRLERANRRTSGLTVVLSGKPSDTIYTDGAPPFRKGVSVSAIFGTEGENIQFNAPYSTWKWNGANSGVAFEGEGEESRLHLAAAPKRNGATPPTNVVARVDMAATLLTAV